MKKINKKIGILIIIVGLFGLILSITINNLTYKESSNTPDSGFDVDYDGGGSDYGGGSDSSGSSYGGSENNIPFNELPLIMQILIVFFYLFPVWIILIFVYAGIKDNKEYKKLLEKRQKNMTHPIFDTLYKNYGLDYNGLLNEAYKIFYDVQIAWTCFNYKKLRENLSDELYNEYEVQLETLKQKNQQNVMFGFEYNEAFLDDVIEENDTITFEINLNVSFHDYIVEHPTELVVRGNRDTVYECEYSLTYRISKNNNQNYCPNCNAPLNNNASGHCPYCNSIVTPKNHKLILVKKMMIGQFEK